MIGVELNTYLCELPIFSHENVYMVEEIDGVIYEISIIVVIFG